jgi:DNA-binding transcriptional MerR regulator
LSRDTVRFYERLGLLGAIPKGAASAYKDYPPSTLARLARIRYAQGLGFTLSEIKEGLDAWMSDRVPEAERIARLRNKLEATRKEERAIVARREALEAQLAARGG